MGAGAPAGPRLGEIVAALRAWLGFAPRQLVLMPDWLMVSVSMHCGAGRAARLAQPGAADRAGAAQGRRRRRPGAMDEATGIKPASLDAILAERPGERAGPLVRAALSAQATRDRGALDVLALSGLVALGPGRAAADGATRCAGVSPPRRCEHRVLECWLDVVLGLLLLVRRFTRPILVIMLVVSLSYLLTGTISRRSCGLIPLGPMVKIIPTLIAMLLTLAILDDR